MPPPISRSLSLTLCISEKWVCPGDRQPATDPFCRHGNWVAMAVRCVRYPVTGMCVSVHVSAYAEVCLNQR